MVTQSADYARTRIDSTQEAVRSGLGMAAESAHRPVSGFQDVFTGDMAKKAMKQSSKHVEAITAASAVISQGFQDISREWMNFAKRGAEQSQAASSAIAGCRSPQSLLEVQSRLVKENLGILVDSTQKMSAISAEIAKNATQKITAGYSHS